LKKIILKGLEDFEVARTRKLRRKRLGREIIVVGLPPFFFAVLFKLNIIKSE